MIEQVRSVTVRELIEQLQRENQDAIVIVAKDSEGNAYSPLYSLWAGAYRSDEPEDDDDLVTTGRVGLASLTDEDRAAGFTGEDVVDGEPAVILCPMS